jgi:hypothetical protein
MMEKEKGKKGTKKNDSGEVKVGEQLKKTSRQRNIISSPLLITQTSFNRI